MSFNLIEYDSEGNVIRHERESTGYALVKTISRIAVVGSALTFGAVGFFGAVKYGGGLGGLGSGGSGSQGSPCPPYGAPDTPAKPTANVVDTSTVTLQSGAFSGDCDDALDSINWQIDQHADNFASPFLDVTFGASLGYGATDNPNFTVGVAYAARVRHKGTLSLAWSSFSDSVAWTNTAPGSAALWPNLPPGLITRTNLDFTSEPLGDTLTNGSAVGPANDWTYIEKHHLTDVVDTTVTGYAPNGVDRVARFIIPQDYGGRTNFEMPGQINFDIPFSSSIDTLFMGWISQYSAAPNTWVNHPVEEKQVYLQSISNDSTGINHYYSRRQSNKTRLVYQYDDKCSEPASQQTDTIGISRGDWFMYEWLRTRNGSTVTDEVWITMWNGSSFDASVKTVDFSFAENQCEDIWKQMQFNPIYGGSGDPVLSTDLYYYGAAATVRTN